MPYAFNADEIFNLAEKIEKNGLAFYTMAVDKFADPEIKKILKNLADMEADHRRTFAQMRTQLGDKERAQTVFDPQDDTALYLQAVADGNVFDLNATADQFFCGAVTFIDVLNYAIAREKDSIVFYLGIVNFVPKNMGQEKIQEIIQEEMNHITLLSSLLKKYPH